MVVEQSEQPGQSGIKYRMNRLDEIKHDEYKAHKNCFELKVLYENQGYITEIEQAADTPESILAEIIEFYKIDKKSKLGIKVIISHFTQAGGRSVVIDKRLVMNAISLGVIRGQLVTVDPESVLLCC